MAVLLKEKFGARAAATNISRSTPASLADLSSSGTCCTAVRTFPPPQKIPSRSWRTSRQFYSRRKPCSLAATVAEEEKEWECCVTYNLSPVHVGHGAYRREAPTHCAQHCRCGSQLATGRRCPSRSRQHLASNLIPVSCCS